MDIGDIIKNLRKEKGLTQKKLAEMTGLAEITIRQYEAKKYVPKQEQYKKLCRALGVDEHSYIFANSVDFDKENSGYAMTQWDDETLDYFAHWIVANDIVLERVSGEEQGYHFHIDNQVYFIDDSQKERLSKSSIELIKVLIKTVGKPDEKL